MALLSKIQSRQNKIEAANDTFNQDFIINGYPSIKITSEDSKTKLTAAIHNKQESDEAYFYTVKSKPLTIGSVWTAKGLYWLISEEIVVIKDVSWHKYHAYLCNVEIDGRHGYFYGPGKSKINVNLKQNTYLMSAQSPILILGGDDLAYRDKFVIKDRAWSVEEYDNITTEGITYYTLAQTTITKNKKFESISKLEPFDNIDGNQDEELRESGEIEADAPVYVIPMTEITLAMKDWGGTPYRAYFDDINSVVIVNRGVDSITFKIKYNVKKCTLVYGPKTYTYTTIKESA